MMMQAIVAAGVEPWHSESFRPADRHNPRGYFEHGDVIRGRSTECPSGVCVKVVGPDAVRFVTRSDKVILMRRGGHAVAASQAEMGFPAGRTTAMLDHAVERLASDIPWAYVADYDYLVDTLDFSGVAGYTGLPAEAMATVVDRLLRHHTEVLP